ncbi:MAG TPA: endopeptidase La [Candidatus Polarisedimenticolia bacterium]|nr:endopeptidase La [Candidatus Polarisedimenticolia bacterium]
MTQATFKNDSLETLPMVPLRDVVVFPHTMIPFVVGRRTSLLAVEHALSQNKKIFLSTQKDAKIDNPSADDINAIGTIANIIQSLKLPNGNIKLLVEGNFRGRVLELHEQEGCSFALVKVIERKTQVTPDLEKEMQKAVSLFEKYVKLSPNLPYETMISTIRVTEPGRLTDTISAHLQVGIEEKQRLLETFEPKDRLEAIVEILDNEIEKLRVDRKIHHRVKKQMEKAQKEYYLSEKMKAIQQELGRKDDRVNEVEELKQKIEEARMPKEAKEKALQELKRLEVMPPISAEATVSRNYLEWLLAVPWSKKSKENRDITRAEKILNEDHYGLEKIKERIVEFLAVRSLVKNPKGSILCLAGPPGVGKTSLAQSIAKATGRKFVRLSLGGVRDEAEIRGHRRTYIGAFPGQIIQLMKKAGARNPVFLLDEVDKMSMDFRGDPSAALLEVLDPEQNATFVDHYLDTEFDLSQVMFIATANVLHTVPPALKDRMEVLRLAGYTLSEKINIAQRFLIPKQLKTHGLDPDKITFEDLTVRDIIEKYTREAGVRNLEREVASICRKIARRVVKEGPGFTLSLPPAVLSDYLGVPKFRAKETEKKNEIGVAVGLAWTEIGGEILTIEATQMKGKGKLTLTGKLGDVMQESAHAALSYVRGRAQDLGVDEDFHRKFDIHIHIPEGAIPKDGPSAGITMTTALVSLLTRIPARGDVAMTGEITLRGKVLPIGGLKEKVLAAHRFGIRTIIIPRDNEKDLADVPPEVQSELDFKLVDTMDDVLKIALARQPAPATGKEEFQEKAIGQAPEEGSDRPMAH